MDINISNYLRINLVDMGFVLVSTFLIVVITKKYFWKYAQDYLEKREAHIANELATAKQNLDESEVIKKQYEDQILNAKKEANDIIYLAKQKAVEESQQIVSSAKTSANLIKDKALQDIEKEKLSVRNQMKQEISEIAFMAAKKVVEKELDEAVHKKYVEDFINEAEGQSWQA